MTVYNSFVWKKIEYLQNFSPFCHIEYTAKIRREASLELLSKYHFFDIFWIILELKLKLCIIVPGIYEKLKYILI